MTPTGGPATLVRTGHLFDAETGRTVEGQDLLLRSDRVDPEAPPFSAPDVVDLLRTVVADSECQATARSAEATAARVPIPSFPRTFSVCRRAVADAMNRRSAI